MWNLYGIALLASLGNSIEPGPNATLSRMTGQPMLAGIVCFLLALSSFFVGMVVARRLNLPARSKVAQVPWWA